MRIAAPEVSAPFRLARGPASGMRNGVHNVQYRTMRRAATVRSHCALKITLTALPDFHIY
jgi:hypothetical protein